MMQMLPLLEEEWESQSSSITDIASRIIKLRLSCCTTSQVTLFLLVISIPGTLVTTIFEVILSTATTTPQLSKLLLQGLCSITEWYAASLIPVGGTYLPNSSTFKSPFSN